MARLMFKIANEKPSGIQSVNSAVPASLAAIIGQALTKDVALRFRIGREMAQALRDCRAALVSVDVQV